jgi:ribosome-binding factor A
MNWRDDRLKSLFLNEINMILSSRQDVKEMAFFTITDVELLNEGKVLNVYFSIFEDDGDLRNKKIQQVSLKLEEISPEIKSLIKKRTKTKFIPNIYFKFDSTPQKAERIEELFKKISLENKDGTST